jgi:hypothetical protein
MDLKKNANMGNCQAFMKWNIPTIHGDTSGKYVVSTCRKIPMDPYGYNSMWI